MRQALPNKAPDNKLYSTSKHKEGKYSYSRNGRKSTEILNCTVEPVETTGIGNRPSYEGAHDSSIRGLQRRYKKSYRAPA